MNSKGKCSYLGATALAALFAMFSGSVLAGSIATYSPDSAVKQQVQAQGDQDPKTPPDCTKYPKDTRCSKK